MFHDIAPLYLFDMTKEELKEHIDDLDKDLHEFFYREHLLKLRIEGKKVEKMQAEILLDKNWRERKIPNHIQEDMLVRLMYEKEGMDTNFLDAFNPQQHD